MAPEQLHASGAMDIFHSVNITGEKSNVWGRGFLFLGRSRNVIFKFFTDLEIQIFGDGKGKSISYHSWL